MVRRPSPTVARFPHEEADASAPAHAARKSLFARALARGVVSQDEIDEALPPGSLSEAERWLLLYSLRAAGVEVREAGPVRAPRADRPARASKKRRP